MKAYYQEWVMRGAHVVSISKDMAQLEQTKREVAQRGTGDKPERKKPLVVEIPDDHDFVERIQKRTIFLHPDELDDIEFIT